MGQNSVSISLLLMQLLSTGRRVCHAIHDRLVTYVTLNNVKINPYISGHRLVHKNPSLRFIISKDIFKMELKTMIIAWLIRLRDAQ